MQDQAATSKGQAPLEHPTADADHAADFEAGLLGPIPEASPPALKSGILNLAEVTRADKKIVGNKAGLLGELHAAGLPVAPGIALCTATCRGLRTTKSFNSELLNRLEDTIEALWPDCAKFAVRTSAVEGERANEQNLRDTRCEYFVPKDALPLAIIAAASAPSEGHIPSPDGSVDRAVVIQPMVAADVSGVVFAGALQAGSSDSYLIESCWGLGRALVEGKTDPDRFQLDRNNKVIDQERGRKQHQIKSEGTGVLVSVSEEARLDLTLRKEQLAEITTLAKRCASALGRAQDIEFAIADEKIVLLQTRPVAAARLAPENVPAGKWVIYTPQLENFSAPFTPLTEDLLRDRLPDFARFIHGRIYLEVAKLNARLPLATTDEELAELLLDRTPTSNSRTHAFSVFKLLRCLPFWLARLPAATLFWARSKTLRKQHIDTSYGSLNNEVARLGLDAKQLFNRLTDRHSSFASLVNLSSARHHLYTRLLHYFANRWSHRPIDRSTLPQLCSTSQHSHAHAIVAELNELGRQVSDAPRLRQAFESALNGLSLHQTISADDSDPTDGAPHAKFLSRLSAFLQRFGHRGPNEFELADPSWSEDTRPLLALIGIAATAGNELKHAAIDNGYRQQLLARDDLHQAIRSAWKRRVVDYLVEKIRSHLTVRDNSRHLAARAFYLVRNELLRIEDRLLREEKLAAAGDLFFLSWQDISYLDHGQLSPDDANTLIAAAKDHHADRVSGSVHWILGFDSATHKRLTADQLQPPSPHSPPSPPSASSEESATAFDKVIGVAAAPGIAEGRARVITINADLKDFQPGEVLVLAMADPTFAPAMQFARAVVCDRGGSLSHLSTMARSWGIPFVGSAANCTRAITSGERLRVDGSSGCIEILPANA